MQRVNVAVILGNALIWAFVMAGVAILLGGTNCYPRISFALGGGAAASVLLVGGGVSRLRT